MSKVPTSADVVVIGGGFAGMATAWWLAKRGIGAIVCEREADLGVYASGRSAGLGRQLAEDDATTQLTIRGAALLREHFAHAWRPTGGILSFDDVAQADAYVARAARFSLPIEILDRDAVIAVWPTLDDLPVARAIRVPSDGVIDVKALLSAYAASATIARETAVQAIEPRATGGVVVTTSRGPIAARVVVDAAGAWAGATTGDPPLASYKRHVFVLGSEPVATAPFLWHLGARELYVRVDGDDVLASPCDAARIEPTDQQPDLVGESHLRTVLDAAGSLGDAQIVRRWACHRSFTEDRQMRLERDASPARPWLVWAAGLGGHGATASAAVGERVAAAVARALT